MNSLLNDGLKAGLRRSSKGSAFISPMDLKFAKGYFQDFASFIEKNPDANRSITLFEYFPHHKITGVNHDDTSFANRGAYGNMLWVMGWTKEENDQTCRQWMRDMSLKTHDEFELRKSSLPSDGNTECGVGEYFNYDGIFRSVISFTDGERLTYPRH